MTSDELLRKFAGGPDELESRVAALGTGILNRRPAYEDAWTIKEHVIHLADSEANNFIRMKSILAQPGSNGFVIDEDAWVRNLRRADEDLGKYLRLFRLLREIETELFRAEIDKNQDYFMRTYKGETKRISVRQGLEIYAAHVDFHLPYIDKIIGVGERIG
jgi:hypothetical protein